MESLSSWLPILGATYTCFVVLTSACGISLAGIADGQTGRRPSHQSGSSIPFAQFPEVSSISIRLTQILNKFVPFLYVAKRKGNPCFCLPVIVLLCPRTEVRWLPLGTIPVFPTDPSQLLFILRVPTGMAPRKAAGVWATVVPDSEVSFILFYQCTSGFRNRWQCFKLGLSSHVIKPAGDPMSSLLCLLLFIARSQIQSLSQFSFSRILAVTLLNLTENCVLCPTDSL